MDRLPEGLYIDVDRLNVDIETKVRESITNGSKLRFALYLANAKVEDALHMALVAVLAKYHRLEWEMAAQLTLKELVTNAAKANLKYLLRGIGKISDDLDDGAALAELKFALQDRAGEKYKNELKEGGLQVTVEFSFEKNGFSLCVTNGYQLSPAEKAQLEKRIEKSRNVEDARAFHAQNRAAAEGAGLGLVLVRNALQAIGLGKDALDMQIGKENRVTARVFFAC